MAAVEVRKSYRLSAYPAYMLNAMDDIALITGIAHSARVPMVSSIAPIAAIFPLVMVFPESFWNMEYNTPICRPV